MRVKICYNVTNAVCPFEVSLGYSVYLPLCGYPKTKEYYYEVRIF